LNGVVFYFGVTAAGSSFLYSGVGVRTPDRSDVLALSEAGIGY